MRLEDTVAENLGEPGNLVGIPRHGDYRRHPWRGEGPAGEIRVLAEVAPIERTAYRDHSGEMRIRGERFVDYGRAFPLGPHADPPSSANEPFRNPEGLAE